MKKNSQESHKLIKKMYIEGEPVPEIAKRSGYKESSIKVILKRAGLRKVKKDYSPYLDTWKRMRSEGKTLREMEEETGISMHIINNCLVKAGYRKNVEHCVSSEEMPLEGLQYAKKKPVRFEKIVAAGKVYIDVTGLFG